ncbi:MAG: hypothetical protein DCF15_17815 [Phormidesmis priestleyi]|uniref:FecR protein domain-containing protein n=1 Tax=Phormidesmis priestleyi TaxID=268141 RepID=A0A2W4Z0H5_9CYAN|nr:MAG: hypothetical protein DCF15_17815 [Phormidesmis priestleyi]
MVENYSTRIGSTQRLRIAVMSVGFSLASLLSGPYAVSAQEQTLSWARIDFLRNQVQLVPSNAGARRARIADVLGIGDALRTAQSSRAELRFNDGSLARIGERATFRFTPNTRNFQLTDGTVLILIPPARGRSTIQTPNAVTGIQGSALFVRYIPETNRTIVGALTDNPNGPMVISNQDGSEQQALYASQIGVIENDRIVEIFDFDLTSFWQTSGLAAGFDYLQPGSDDLNGVREEIREAIANQGTFDAGEQVIENPPSFRRPDTTSGQPVLPSTGSKPNSSAGGSNSSSSNSSSSGSSSSGSSSSGATSRNSSQTGGSTGTTGTSSTNSGSSGGTSSTHTNNPTGSNSSSGNTSNIQTGDSGASGSTTPTVPSTPVPSSVGSGLSDPLETVTGVIPGISAGSGITSENGLIPNSVINPDSSPIDSTVPTMGSEPSVDSGVDSGVHEGPTVELEPEPPTELEYGGFAEAYLNGAEPNPALNSLEPIPSGGGEVGAGTVLEDDLSNPAPMEPSAPAEPAEPANAGNASELEGVSDLPGDGGSLESTPTAGPPLEAELEPSDTTPIVSGGSAANPVEPANPLEETTGSPAVESGPVEDSQKALTGVSKLFVNFFEGLF